MSEPVARAAARCHHANTYCVNCDLLVGLDDLHVIVWRKRTWRCVAFPTCPIKEIKRLGKTLQQWREAFLAYFDTGRANNGGAEAINGLIELQRRIARGFRNRDHYRLRMLLIGGGLTSPRLK